MASDMASDIARTTTSRAAPDARVGPRAVHLQVASCFSLQYGTSTPQAIAARAADLGHDCIALTDRDGLYGAVQWIRACERFGIAAILGVELAVDPVLAEPGGTTDRTHGHRRRSPARGGSWIDEDRPRVVFLGRGRSGWASLCRMVSAAHGLAPDGSERRNTRWLDLDEVATHADDVVAILGPDSEVGRLILARRADRARGVLDPWRAIFGDRLRIGVTHQRRPIGHRYSLGAAAQLLGWAAEQQTPTVLLGGVRTMHPEQSRVADVLDASRLLVPLGSGRIELGNGEAFLTDPGQLTASAVEIAMAAGSEPRELIARTRATALDCRIIGADLGIGDVFVPELDVLVGYRVPEREAVTLAQRMLHDRCDEQIPVRYAPGRARQDAEDRLADELRVIGDLGFAGYFLTVAEVVSMTRRMGIRVAARGSGAGSLVNYLLGISGAEPIGLGLLMERFLSPLRRVLPDIDIDVESARRLEVYDAILDRFGAERVSCVSMMETYRVRHAIRDTGAAFGMPPAEIDTFAKAFPHIRARDARTALRDLPELSRIARLTESGALDEFWSIVEALDGLPRHVAMHPCGVLLSDTSLRDRTPVQPSAAGYPMSQFDKDDVEELGLLKLDVLGVRMQSAMAHAVDEIERCGGGRVDLDSLPLDDAATFSLIRSTRTLGCFQIESPGQRELIGKLAPQDFADIVIDISLFRPGPVKSDMITPFLRARHGWAMPEYLHPDLREALTETCGVVVFHEQVLRIISVMTGCSLAESDDRRRSMNTPEGIDDVRAWFVPAALRRRYPLPVVERVWEVLRSFASFGFCKAHAAAFALPTYQSAWLKTHHPAAFYAGVLTHDPGMYPKRLILDDARNHDVAILGVDINDSGEAYRVVSGEDGMGIRLPLAEVRGISEQEISSIIDGQPYTSLADAWQRSGMSRPTAEHLVVAGAFDGIYRFAATSTARRRGRLTRRDLLLQISELDRRAAAQRSVGHGQLCLALGDDPTDVAPSGLPEMSDAERVRAEMDVLGLDVSQHVLAFYAPMLDGLGITRAARLLACRSGQEILLAGVKVATQTPPIRSGRRVVFLTIDDSTGPADATFFEDAQGPYAQTVFHSWLLLIRGEVRRTGPRGVSIRATGCWDLGNIREQWLAEGVDAVIATLDADRPLIAQEGSRPRRVLVHASGFRQSPYADVRPAGGELGRSPATRLWHASPGSSGW